MRPRPGFARLLPLMAFANLAAGTLTLIARPRLMRTAAPADRSLSIVERHGRGPFGRDVAPAPWISRRSALNASLADALDGTDVTRVTKLLRQGASPLAKSRKGVTTAMFMAAFGDQALLRKMLDAEVEVNATGRDGESALMWAACDWTPDGCRLLIERGANVRRDGGRALTFAVMGQHVETVRLLLAHGVDVNDKYHGATTPVMWAAGDDSLEILKTLLRHSPDLSARDEEGQTALMIAAIGRPTEEDTYLPKPCHVRLLLEHGARVGARNASGETALDIARKRGFAAVCRMLRRAGARG
jgi:hypothetical protein